MISLCATEAMRGTCHGNETIRMERMLTGKNVESLGYQSQSTLPALVRLVDGNETIPQILNILLDRFRRLSRVVHLGPERFNLGSIFFQSRAYFQFKIVNDHKVGEKGQDVFNLDQISGFEEFDRAVAKSAFEIM